MRRRHSHRLRLGEAVWQWLHRSDIARESANQGRGPRKTINPCWMPCLPQASLIGTRRPKVGRNVVVSPFWYAGDRTFKLAQELEERLGEIPALPDKIGFVIDTGPAPMLGDVSGDFRLESASGGRDHSACRRGAQRASGRCVPGHRRAFRNDRLVCRDRRPGAGSHRASFVAGSTTPRMANASGAALLPVPLVRAELSGDTSMAFLSARCMPNNLKTPWLHRA